MYVMIVWGVLSLLLCMHYAFELLKRLRQQARRFNYSIADLWMAAAVLAPVTYLIASEIRDWQPGNWTWEGIKVLCLWALVLLNQLCGMVVGRLDIELPPFRRQASSLGSASSVGVGGIYGALTALLPLVFAHYMVQYLSIRLDDIDGALLRERLDRNNSSEPAAPSSD